MAAAAERALIGPDAPVPQPGPTLIDDTGQPAQPTADRWASWPAQRASSRNRRTLAIARAAAAVVVIVAVLAGVGYLVFGRAPSREAASKQAEPPTGPPSSSQVVLPFTIGDPDGGAVDTAGSVYVADSGNNRVLNLPVGSDTPAEFPFTGLREPHDVAVDSSGCVYVVDSGNNRVLKLAAGTSTPVSLPFTGLNFPNGVAVDRNGSVYISDLNNNRVLRLTAGSDTPSTLPFVDLFFPYGVAVDTADNVYVADFHNRVLKLPAR